MVCFESKVWSIAVVWKYAKLVIPEGNKEERKVNGHIPSVILIHIPP